MVGILPPKKDVDFVVFLFNSDEGAAAVEADTSG